LLRSYGVLKEINNALQVKFQREHVKENILTVYFVEFRDNVLKFVDHREAAGSI
jgi:hypothetical protein